jgi:anaphase-promoting complex subunit 3
MKEEDFKQAIVFIKKAYSINNNSANLSSMLANAYLQNKEINKALKTLDDAEKIDPSNHLVKYQKANILFLLRKFDESLIILLDLKEKVPKEAPIYILIGNIFKAKKDYKSALYHYNQALDLDNKDYNSAKAAIEKLMMETDNSD